MTAVASLTRARVVVDHTMPTPLQRSTELKISLIFFDQCLYPIKTLSSVKNILSKRFSMYVFHSHSFDEMFIVSGKSHCCNDTLTDVRFTSLLAKNISEEYKLFLFHKLFCLKISVKLVTFSIRVMQENKSGCFFWTQCIYRHFP